MLLIFLLIIILLIYFNQKKSGFENYSNYKPGTLGCSCKLCPTCKPVKLKKNRELQYYSKNNNNIPLWLKKQSIYSLLPKPILLNEKYNYYNNRNFKSHSGCKKECSKYRFNLGEYNDIVTNRDTWIFYWATKKRNYKNYVPLDPETAYDKYQNSGLTIADNNNDCKVLINDPAIYKYDGKAYPPHFNFTYLLPDKTWSNVIYTVNVFPSINKISLAKILKKKRVLLINSLPIDKGEIPGSIRIPFNNLPKVQDINSLITQKIKKKNYSRFRKYIKLGLIENYELPIVVYGKDKNCDTFNIVFNYLLSIGFVNLIKYKGGLADWFKAKL